MVVQGDTNPFEQGMRVCIVAHSSQFLVQLAFKMLFAFAMTSLTFERVQRENLCLQPQIFMTV